MASPIIVRSVGMRLFPTLIGSVVGGAALSHIKVPDAVKMMFGLGGNGSDGGGGGDTSALFAQLAELKNALALRSNAVTIVQSEPQGGGKGTLYTVAWVAAGAGIGYVVLRISGRSVFDVFWVTRSAFSQGMSSLSSGLESLSSKMKSIRHALSERIDALGKKQDEALAMQVEMGEAIGHVGTKIEVTQRSVHLMQESIFSMSSRVEALEGKLDEVTSKQDSANEMMQYSNRGIHLLCGVVSHSLADAGNHIEAARDLRAFANMSPLPLPSACSPIATAIKSGNASLRDSLFNNWPKFLLHRSHSASVINPDVGTRGDDAA